MPTAPQATRQRPRAAARPLDLRRRGAYAVLAELRREHGVVRVEEPEQLGWPEGPGYWLVLRHPDVVRVLRDPKTFSSWLGGTQIRDPATPEDLAFVRRMMLNMDPPEHSRLRRMLAKSFTPRAIGRLSRQIAGHARRDRRPDARRRGQGVRLRQGRRRRPAAAGAGRHPRRARRGPLADVRLVEPRDRLAGPRLRLERSLHAGRAARTRAAALAVRPSPGPDGRMPDPRTRAGMPDLYPYAAGLGERKRAVPGDDVMSILMAQRDDAAGGDGHVSIEEFENLFWLFAVAGNETLRNGLPGAMIALIENPEAQRALRADPSLIAGAVDEMLRWWTPVMTFRRTATADVELAGQPIRAGDKVVVSFASANRDEGGVRRTRAFRRPDRNANPHLAFGHGPHFCLGAHLARVQMTALFTEVLSRTSPIGAAGQPAYLRSNFQRGVKRLPIRWTA